MLAVATVNYDGLLIPCFLADLSRGGARIRLLEMGNLPRGPIVLESSRLGLVPMQVVWQRGLFAGLKFAVGMLTEASARHTIASSP